MQEVFRAIGRLAQSHITVLINGESGTGKELVARALHRQAPRQQRVRCTQYGRNPSGADGVGTLRSRKGAFTGANSRREGRFEQARGGTLFLDEIGDMPAATQTRLLRVLQDVSFSASAASTRSRQTYGSSPRPTRSWNHWWKPERSGKTVPPAERDSHSCPETLRAPGGHPKTADPLFNRRQRRARCGDKDAVRGCASSADPIAVAEAMSDSLRTLVAGSP
ncbi:MAG: hypothetical protein CM15mP103_00530 [Gammaproteobacteria bacterium]|nr:MAG: hypothetical protein CM15mP103_00530 [Gammaproteobacteria bacterium]